jgi:hypothetical protein
VSGASSTITWSSTNATSCTASGAWSGTKVASGSQTTGTLSNSSTYTITCTGAGGSATASTAITVTGTAQAGTCGATSVGGAWVYYNGAMSSSWPNDYSYGGLVADYKDTSGAPMSGAYDIKITTPSYGGWQPASLNWVFDVSGCNYLTFAIKPTAANQTFNSYFMYVGDISTGVSVDVTASGYGPSTPVVGQWNVYKIPLTAYFPNGAVPASIYKFAIQDTGGSGSSHVWYLDNVGFTGN